MRLGVLKDCRRVEVMVGHKVVEMADEMVAVKVDLLDEMLVDLKVLLKVGRQVKKWAVLMVDESVAMLDDMMGLIWAHSLALNSELLLVISKVGWLDDLMEE